MESIFEQFPLEIQEQVFRYTQNPRELTATCSGAAQVFRNPTFQTQWKQEHPLNTPKLIRELLRDKLTTERYLQLLEYYLPLSRGQYNALKNKIMEEDNLEVYNFLFQKQIGNLTDLNVAIELKAYNIIKFLFQEGADTNEDTITAVVENFNLDIATLVLKFYHCWPRVYNFNSWLYSFAAKSIDFLNLEALKFFIREGAPLQPHNEDSLLLIAATKKGTDDIIEYLLSIDADIDTIRNLSLDQIIKNPCLFQRLIRSNFYIDEQLYPLLTNDKPNIDIVKIVLNNYLPQDKIDEFSLLHPSNPLYIATFIPFVSDLNKTINTLLLTSGTHLTTVIRLLEGKYRVLFLDELLKIGTSAALQLREQFL